MADLSALIERVVKLTGPSREIDVLIGYATDLRIEGMGTTFRAFVDLHDKIGEVVRLAESHQNILRHELPRYTASLDAAIALTERVLPGWSWRVATCCVSDDAWVQPDFNCPVHGERLKSEFDERTDWVEITDVDLRPSGRPSIALLLATLRALQAQEKQNG